MNSSTCTFVVDPSRLSREGLQGILNRGGFRVAFETSDIRELGAAEEEPDLIVIDCGTDADVAGEALALLRRSYPHARIVVLTGSSEPALLAACYAAPIDGLITRNISSTILLHSLQLVLAGERVFSSQLVSMVLGGHTRPVITPARLQAADPALSEREIEILQCLVSGDSNKSIANQLGIAEATIKVHLKSILRKIQVRNRTQAAIWALEHGMRPLNPPEDDDDRKS